MTAAPDRFETVAYVYSPSDLALLLSLFGHHGFHVQTAGRGHSSVELGLTTALGGVVVRVHALDAAEARAMLSALDPPDRAPLLFGWWPLDLLFFFVVGLLGAAPPPRQLPCYLTGAAIARDGD